MGAIRGGAYHLRLPYQAKKVNYRLPAEMWVYTGTMGVFT